MKYNLDNLHWQEFELLSFKVLQILVAPNVQFIEGGNDKGRDIVYTGTSAFNKTFSGRWLFQVKHKSKSTDDFEIGTSLSRDLKKELTKVFVVNKMEYENYIFVTNKSINGSLFDQLGNIFKEFKKSNQIKCENFSIISYRHLESVIENSDALKWSYPNIISHPDFLLLLKDATNYNLKNRRRGWLNGLEKQREKFVDTQFFEKAHEKLSEFPAIILSGPPKSGKSFNAEMLALNFSVFSDYQPILIDNPSEIEDFFEIERKQIFICDDAFGKYSLSYRAEEWFDKLDRIFNLADRSHLFVFTSREYIFRAFINYGNDNAKAFLEKILVESHNYFSHEKLGILKRYTTLSDISDYDKVEIFRNELALISHKNFAPETIRAFFANIDGSKDGSQLNELQMHLNRPDSYLSTVFFKLTTTKQAVLLAVLCTKNNNEKAIYKTFDNICGDLNLNQILNSNLEFDELDDSILRILKTDKIEEINFYHPSMEEFLIRQVIANESGKLKEVVLKNLNIELLSTSVMKSSKKTILHLPNVDLIKLSADDIQIIQIGIDRLIRNEEVSLHEVTSIFKWFKSEYHTMELKMSDKAFFSLAKEMIARLIAYVSSDIFYNSHGVETCSAWSQFFFGMKNTLSFYSIDLKTVDFSYLEKLLKEKYSSEFYWMLVLRVLGFTSAEFISNSVGKRWLNDFYSQLNEDIKTLGFEIFGDDFPKFERYKEKLKQRVEAEKIVAKPNRTWYPRFLNVKDRIDILKEVKGTYIGNKILERVSNLYEELSKQREFAKNRHEFNSYKGWWTDS